MATKKTRVSRSHPVKRRLLNYLQINGNYVDSDEEIIDLYAETFDFYQKMRDELAESNYLMEYTNKAGATNLVKNPLLIEISKTVQTLNQLLKSMGMTPAQRKAMVAPGGGDEFDEFPDNE